MTQIAIKGNISQHQMDVVMSMLKSWNVEAETIEPSGIYPAKTKSFRQLAVQQAKGCLSEYANINLIEQEKEAWANHVKEQYENL